MLRTVTHSKLNIKKTVGRKCLYLLHKLFDFRNKLHCVRTSAESWLLWDFDCLRAPKFDDDILKLADYFPLFCNVYQVSVHRNSTQNFLKCGQILFTSVPSLHEKHIMSVRLWFFWLGNTDTCKWEGRKHGVSVNSLFIFGNSIKYVHAFYYYLRKERMELGTNNDTRRNLY